LTQADRSATIHLFVEHDIGEQEFRMKPAGRRLYEPTPRTDISALLPKDSIEKLLSAALGRGGDFAEVYIQPSRSTYHSPYWGTQP